MLDHIGFAVSDFARSRAFYLKALAPLGYAPVMDVTREQTGGYEGTGFGTGGKPSFWIGNGEKTSGPSHVAFKAPTREAVDRFHAAAIAAGGRDNGPPGIRAHYHPDYYGAFVFDPDGNNVEAVCHVPA
ncbi:MAG TPA: VOC family protein [Rhodanobacteraceae bacterium]|nr:VOC family protein [Rhodanobacteraceae bacterium]